MVSSPKMRAGAELVEYGRLASQEGSMATPSLLPGLSTDFLHMLPHHVLSTGIPGLFSSCLAVGHLLMAPKFCGRAHGEKLRQVPWESAGRKRKQLRWRRRLGGQERKRKWRRRRPGLAWLRGGGGRARWRRPGHRRRRPRAPQVGTRRAWDFSLPSSCHFCRRPRMACLTSSWCGPG